MIPYQSPPGSGGNDGALPTTWNPLWPQFDGLTQQQILAFQAFPQDLMDYSNKRLAAAVISGVTINNIPLATTPIERGELGRLLQSFDKAAFATTKFIDAGGVIHTLSAPQVQQLFVGMMQFMNSLYGVYDSLNSSINTPPPAITTRKQIDAAYATVAPNSPSAINPSPI